MGAGPLARSQGHRELPHRTGPFAAMLLPILAPKYCASTARTARPLPRDGHGIFAKGHLEPRPAFRRSGSEEPQAVAVLARAVRSRPTF